MELNEYQVKAKEFKCSNCFTLFKKFVLKQIPLVLLGEIVICPLCKKMFLFFDEHVYETKEIE